MKHYTIKIKPLAPFLTPMQSDTIFGHICWAMVYLRIFNGDKSLAAFLDRFTQSEPPLVISNAFPDGYLPFPILPVSARDKQKSIKKLFTEKISKEGKDVEKNKEVNLAYEQWKKRMARQKYIAIETFMQYRNSFDFYQLYSDVLAGHLREYRFSQNSDSVSKESESETIEVHHNAINRLTNQVIEGRFFSRATTFYRPGVTFVVYLKTDYFSKEELEAIFSFIGQSGFGGDKTTGYGQFSYQLEEGITFLEGEPVEGFNAYMLLSNTHPSVLQGHEVYYSMCTKFGRVGGLYSMDAGISHLKNPVILLEPGSVVITNQVYEYFGENYQGIHPQLPQLRHYGIGFPVQVRF